MRKKRDSDQEISQWIIRPSESDRGAFDVFSMDGEPFGSQVMCVPVKGTPVYEELMTRFAVAECDLKYLKDTLSKLRVPDSLFEGLNNVFNSDAMDVLGLALYQNLKRGSGVNKEAKDESTL